MELTINHEVTFFEQLPASLEALIQQKTKGKTKGIAVALNHQVIPKSAWPQTILQHKDAILIITATQGG